MADYGPLAGNLTITSTLSSTLQRAKAKAGALTITSSLAATLVFTGTEAGGLTITSTLTGVMAYAANANYDSNSERYFTVVTGATTSWNSVRCPAGMRLAFIQAPSTVTGNWFWLESSLDGGATFQTVYDEDGPLTAPVVADAVITFDAHKPITGVLKLVTQSAQGQVTRFKAYFEGIN
jgi:hypothetical protein